MTIDEEEIKHFFENIKSVSSKFSRYIHFKESVSLNVKSFYDGWEKIVYGFKKGILPFSKMDDMKIDSGDQQPDISDTPKQTKFNDFLEQIKKAQRNIDMKHFILASIFLMEYL